MYRATIASLALLVCSANLCHGQVSGNIAYSDSGASGRAAAMQNERNKRTLTRHELPPSGTSMSLEANVLMNVNAAEYIAVFGIVQEGESVAQCQEQIDARIQEFTTDLKGLGITDDRLFVDFVAQNRIYGFEVTGDIAQEKLVGFELKKNVSVRYQDHALLDKLVAAAARREIFDLIKVDYVVAEPAKIRERLLEEATRIVKQKRQRYDELLGIKLRAPAQIFAERYASYSPASLYDSYTAFEGQTMGSAFHRQRYTVQEARKSRTFFFHGLDAGGYDVAINPDPIAPVVQFTLYLKVKYEIEGEAGKEKDEATQESGNE